MLDKTIIPITMLFTKYHSIFYIIKHIRNIVNINLRNYYLFSMVIFFFGAVLTILSLSETGYMSALWDKIL